jgi:hypothetical protein
MRECGDRLAREAAHPIAVSGIRKIHRAKPGACSITSA